MKRVSKGGKSINSIKSWSQSDYSEGWGDGDTFGVTEALGVALGEADLVATGLLDGVAEAEAEAEGLGSIEGDGATEGTTITSGEGVGSGAEVTLSRSQTR